MNEGITQSAEGNIGLIQVAEMKDSFILQVINNIHAPRDLDQAILTTHKRVEDLQWRKGCRDGRILLVVATTVFIAAACFRHDIYSIGLAGLGTACLYAGQRLDRYITRLNTEISATNAVLMELYKQKISRQIDDK